MAFLDEFFRGFDSGNRARLAREEQKRQAEIDALQRKHTTQQMKLADIQARLQAYGVATKAAENELDQYKGQNVPMVQPANPTAPGNMVEVPQPQRATVQMPGLQLSDLDPNLRDIAPRAVEALYRGDVLAALTEQKKAEAAGEKAGRMETIPEGWDPNKPLASLTPGAQVSPGLLNVAGQLATSQMVADRQMALERERQKGNLSLENVRAQHELALEGVKALAKQTGSKLSPTQQQDLADMMTLTKLTDEMTGVGEKIGWKGVGGMKAGSIKEFTAKNLGMGDKDEVLLRAYIGNVKGIIAKIRGGTSFTENEQKLLESYTPGIDDPPLVIKAKAEGLKNFMRIKSESIYQVAGGGAPAQAGTGTGATPSVEDLRKQYGY